MPLLGLATVQVIDGASEQSLQGSCGLAKWCFSMLRLAAHSHLAGNADVLVLTNEEATVRSLCVRLPSQPPLRVLPLDLSLQAAIDGWSRVLNYSRTIWTRQLSLHAMYKLQVFRLTEYQAVLFTDADVNFFGDTAGIPPASTSRAGRSINLALTAGLSSFLSSQQMLTASADFHSPINTAVMLLKPSLSIFARGLAVLERARFDRLRGFDLIGRPRDVLAHLNTTILWAEVSRTRMVDHNDWNFVGGHGCQGLFVYLFLIELVRDPHQLPVGFPLGYAARRKQHLGTLRVHHFRGHHKPWRAGARCPDYFRFLEHSTAHNQTQSHCWRMLWEKRRCLEPRLSSAACTQCRAKGLASLCGTSRRDCMGTGVLVF